jgi:hypothetical protein
MGLTGRLCIAVYWIRPGDLTGSMTGGGFLDQLSAFLRMTALRGVSVCFHSAVSQNVFK